MEERERTKKEGFSRDKRKKRNYKKKYNMKYRVSRATVYGKQKEGNKEEHRINKKGKFPFEFVSHCCFPV
jgi:hypothetical protein